MKKIGISFVFLFMPYVMFGICKDVYKYNPQTNPDGTKTYRDVKEQWNDGNGLLECYHPGTKQCKWEDGTPGLVITVNGMNLTEEQIDALVLAAIQSGNLSGTVMGDETGYYSWSAVDANDYQFTICDGL